MPKVSVIVPVYGVERYIERCARSLLEQTLDDMEFIFIDDCSPDNSMSILKNVLSDYPKRASEIRLLSMARNSGQALVRKLGIASATGDYVIHCDSDDYVSPEMYRKMYELAEDRNLDCVLCGFYEVIGQQMTKGRYKTDDEDDILRNILCNQWGGVLWNKMVRRDIVQSDYIQYPETNFWEDQALSVQYALKCTSVGLLDEDLYFYCRRPDSTVGNGFDSETVVRNAISAAENFRIVIDSLKDCKMADQYGELLARRQMYLKNQIMLQMPFPKCTSVYRSVCSGINSKVIFSPYFSFREKMAFIASWTGIYSFVVRLK